MIDFFRAPLVGASVTLDGLPGITDENGTVTFEVPARSYTVSVSAQNFLPDSQSISVRLGQEVDVYFVLNRDIPNPKEEGSWWDEARSVIYKAATAVHLGLLTCMVLEGIRAVATSAISLVVKGMAEIGTEMVIYFTQPVYVPET